jgi:hypothetical protein
VSGGAVAVQPDEEASQTPQLLRGKVRWLATTIRAAPLPVTCGAHDCGVYLQATEQMGLRSFFCSAAGTRLSKKNPGVGI